MELYLDLSWAIDKLEMMYFTHVDSLPFFRRSFSHIRRPGCQVPSGYHRHSLGGNNIFKTKGVETEYMLIEYIEPSKGKMLPVEWFTQQGDNSTWRKNFFRDYSCIMLSVSRIPLPVIGSFIIDSNGFLQLKNHPLTLEVQDLENEEIPTGIPRDYTYDTVDSYVTDVLGMHDSRIQHQPNAINDINDFIYQISALTAMRATFPTFFRRELRRGPFVFALTDFHQSNALVDKDWHINR